MVRVFGIFPSVCPGVFGGIEESGRLAWRAIQAAHAQQCLLLSYEPGKKNEPGKKIRGPEHVVRLKSKLHAISVALRNRRPAGFIIVWHVGLLRLLPFLNCTNSRVILFLHGIEAWKRQGTVLRFLLKRVDLILSNSEYTWRRFVQTNPEFTGVNHTTVHLGAGKLPPSTACAPDSIPALLMIGRLAKTEDYKGHREVIAAWPLVRERIPEAELWIAGDGDLRPELEALAASLHLANQVRFFGRISEEDKQELISRCHGVALPSRGEGFGLVYLESMRLARPCLVSTLDAGREVVNPPEAGLAVDPSDRRGLAAAAIRLLSVGPEWERWASGAQRRWETLFTEMHFEQRLLNALASLS